MAKKRTRTIAPGSRIQTNKKTQKPIRLFNGIQNDPKLRHTALLKTQDGRRKQLVSYIPLDRTDGTPGTNPLDDETELETFKHFLDDAADGDWLPVDEDRGKLGQRSETKKKKVRLPACK